MTSLHGDAALAYAARGWRVVPSWALAEGGACQCQRGADCGGSAGKHPRVKGWVDAATCDLETVAGWWDAWPDANVSIVTGAESGLFVVDVDAGKGGFDSIEEYERTTEFGLPLTLTAVTGGGGRHMFYRWPKDGSVVRNVVNWLPGVDVRGEGGQVVAPPSPHRSGRFYTWSAGWEEGPAEAPAELVARIVGASAGRTAAGGEREDLPSSASILEGLVEGERNDVLFRWACRLRRQLRDDRRAVEVLVREAAAAAAPPVSDGEVAQIVDSAFKQDHALNLPTGWAALSAPLPPPAGFGLEGQALRPEGGEAFTRDPSRDPVAGDQLPLTDVGNARRLVRAHGEDLRWCSAWDWVCWDGRRWARDEVLEARRRGQDVARLVALEAEAEEDPEGRARLAKWAIRSQSSGSVSATLQEAAALLASRADSFDADPWALNAANGTVDLRSGRVRPHERASLITRLVPTRWEPGAPAPRWRAFVELVLPDPEVRWWVQRAVGYSLTGVVDAKSVVFLHGAGNNGKSVFLETLRELVYGDYAGTMAKSVVVKGYGSEEHSTVVASLAGARFVTLAEEIEPSERLNAGRVKSMTGGDEQKARFMRQDEFTFKPQAKLWVATNHRPGLVEFSPAIRTRLRLVPFEHQFGPDERRDADEVRREFREEAEGVMAWAAEGLRGWLEQGLDPPSTLLAEVEDWMSGDDAVGSFLQERCDAVPADELLVGGGSSATVLHGAYSTWAAVNGEPPIQRKTFMRDLDSRGIARTRGRSGQGARYALKVREVGAYGV